MENQIKKLALLGLGSQNSLAPTNFTNKLIPKLFGLPCPRFQLMLGHKGEVGQQWQLFLLQNEPPLIYIEVWGVEVLLFSAPKLGSGLHLGGILESLRFHQNCHRHPLPPKTPVLHNVLRNLAQPFQLQDNRLRIHGVSRCNGISGFPAIRLSD